MRPIVYIKNQSQKFERLQRIAFRLIYWRQRVWYLRRKSNYVCEISLSKILRDVRRRNEEMSRRNEVTSIYRSVSYSLRQNRALKLLHSSIDGVSCFYHSNFPTTILRSNVRYDICRLCFTLLGILLGSGGPFCFRFWLRWVVVLGCRSDVRGVSGGKSVLMYLPSSETMPHRGRWTIEGAL